MDTFFFSLLSIYKIWFKFRQNWSLFCKKQCGEDFLDVTWILMFWDLEKTTSPSLVFLIWNIELMIFPCKSVVKIGRNDTRYKVNSQRLGAKVRVISEAWAGSDFSFFFLSFFFLIEGRYQIVPARSRLNIFFCLFFINTGAGGACYSLSTGTKHHDISAGTKIGMSKSFMFLRKVWLYELCYMS